MSVELNHTIVHAQDNRDSAEFFAKLLGLDITAEWGPFIAVGLSNGVTLDFATIPADSITPQHDFARYPVKQETCRDAVELASTLLPTVPGVTRAVVLVTNTGQLHLWRALLAGEQQIPAAPVVLRRHDRHSLRGWAQRLGEVFVQHGRTPGAAICRHQWLALACRQGAPAPRRTR